jgi:hypothetical protein
MYRWFPSILKVVRIIYGSVIVPPIVQSQFESLGITKPPLQRGNRLDLESAFKAAEACYTELLW